VTSRREFLATGTAALYYGAGRVNDGATGTAQRPVPRASQLVWQQDELALFLHFGVNTFTDREWGDGREDPGIFNPGSLDARAWARTARRAGFKAMILTAKHHDGFCLWPSATTRHSVASSPWRGGTGDLVREFTDACRAEGLRAGLYLSPWDRNAAVYGDSPRYNDFYCDQLTELLTRYGPIHEVWFDGANGEGPNGRRQQYDWPRYWGLVRRLQPEAVMFSDAGPDVRWIGNEIGSAGDPNWSTVNPATVPVPGMSGDAVMRMLQHGDPHGTAWRPGETDVSIRPRWFHHPAQDEQVRSVDNMLGLYFTSVGRNSKLLLNVPPTRDGVLHPTDAERLLGLRSRLDRTFERDLLPLLRRGRRVRAAIADLREDITSGQRVSRYRVEGLVDGAWRTLSAGQTIGYRKLDRFESVLLTDARVIVEESLGATPRIQLALYEQAE